MLLSPKRVKYRKQQRGRLKGIAQSGHTLAFGDYGIKAVESGYLTARQIEAVRVALVRSLKRGAKIWIRIFPDRPYTKKPAETRMGKGKGNVEYWTARVIRGKMLFEYSGVARPEAERAYKLASAKLPIKVRFVTREEGGV